MSEQKPSLAAEIEAVKQIYAAINRKDIPAAMEFSDPQIERIEPPGFPSAGTYRGHAEVVCHFVISSNHQLYKSYELTRTNQKVYR